MKINKLSEIALGLALCTSNAYALTLSGSMGTIANYCGAYASVIPNGSSYDIYSNEIPNTKASCPGTGCPGIVKYSGSLTSPVYKGVVAPNSIINDVFNADGTLSSKRMFSRPVVARDGLGYVAIAMVANGYPPADNQVTPSFLTSPDGIKWTYHGKFKGEPYGLNIYGSGMSLIVSDTYPRYTFYTDGYGKKMVGLYSNGGNDWSFIRTTSNTIADLNPVGWRVPIFQSVAEVNGIYYMAASDNWPVKGWMFAHSDDGVNWINDKYVTVTSTEKNISLYLDNGRLKALATSSLKGNCYKKTMRSITP